jgi:hypothetical protein
MKRIQYKLIITGCLGLQEFLDQASAGHFVPGRP